jgi:hypothetical protein
LPTSIIRDNHPVKRGHRIHPDRRSLSSELSRYTQPTQRNAWRDAMAVVKAAAAARLLDAVSSPNHF